MFDQAGPVLGIDPGLSRCGYGAVRPGGGELTMVALGVFETPKTLPLPDRLAMLEADLAQLVADIGPSAMAVERVLFQANVRTAISVGQASGLALAVASRASVPVTHYSPNEVKLAVTGYGAADKAQVQVMVQRLLGLDSAPPPDAADALALALCHGSSASTRTAAAAEPPGRGLERAVAAALAREGAK
ncbi:MAG: crossover junction endodeoxyribonuclease RuvC [Acidimicrobiia bacterium]